MAGYKETPRQKMIGMMYLVLTALLALNVSKQILDAFLVVNESMETTNENFSKKLDNSLAKFKIQYQLNPKKVGPYWDKAQEAHKLAFEFEKYVDSLKYLIIQKTEGLPTLNDAKKISLREVKKKDNFDTPTNFFIAGSTDGSKGESRKLKNRIEEFKKKMVGMLDEKYRGVIKTGMDTKGPYFDADGKKQNWEMHNFYHTILAADVTILNKIKAEIFNLEFDVTNVLFSAISAEDFKYDKIAARVIPKSNYVFEGEDYEAEIVVAAFDTKATPNVRYTLGSDTMLQSNFNSGTQLEGVNGVVTMKLAASGEGLKKFAGIIKIVSPTGDTMKFHFHDSFIVAKTSITISPTKMNVFYVGIDNPIDISVPGGPEKVNATISVGNIRPEGKGWIVSGLPKGVGQAVISVSAVFAGKSKNMGSGSFRLKLVPDPVIKVGGMASGTISKSILMAQPYITCEMPVGFDFDLKFKVTSCSFGTILPNGSFMGEPISGNKLINPDKGNTDKVYLMLKNLSRNQRVWIENIKVMGPDGPRDIPITTTLKVN
ncbi:MAG: gliding motility protein GldM [Bacteroidota bacterium]